MAFKRSVIILLLLSLMLSAAGCAVRETPDEKPQEGLWTPTPEPPVKASPAPVLSGVETDRKVVSLIFEGFTDTTTMDAIVRVLRDRNVSATFFVSGITANENPQAVRSLASKGFDVGSYGMSGGKHLEELSDYENMRRFEMAQKEIAAACGETPSLIRCNGTKYTDGVLRAVTAAGLKAAVQPTAYLNHRSFRMQEDAEVYAMSVLSGSILSFKLGQELDADEYGDVGHELDERPAIDPSPGVRWEWSGEEERFALLPDIVGWLVDALKAHGYRFTDPESLQSEKRLILRKANELTPEEQTLLDPDNYPLPVTEEPLYAGKVRAARPGDFRGAVFVGDAVLAGLGAYVDWRREKEPDFLDDAQFLTDDALSVETLLEGESEIGNLAEKLAEMKASSVWLCLGFANAGAYRSEAFLAKYRMLIKEIREKSPDTRIVIMSVFPKVERFSGVSNRSRFELSLRLCAMCREYGIGFSDAASVLRDENGQLREEYCLDLAGRGCHLNDSACRAVTDYVKENVPV